MSLPWQEKCVSFQINPESATIADVVRMAEELVELWQHGEGKEPEKLRGKYRDVLTPTDEWESWAGMLANMITHNDVWSATEVKSHIIKMPKR